MGCYGMQSSLFARSPNLETFENFWKKIEFTCNLHVNSNTQKSGENGYLYVIECVRLKKSCNALACLAQNKKGLEVYKMVHCVPVA